LNRFYRNYKIILILLFAIISLKGFSQGNRLSVQSSSPKLLSICGINDTARIEIYNISSGTVSNITVKLNLSPGISYILGSVAGTGVTESNVSNLNQPVFSVPSLSIAKNLSFRVSLSSDCNLLTYLNNNNTPVINVRADYTGNFDLGASIPFSVKVPSAQFNTVTNLSYTGDLGTKFSRTITIGNYGKGPLKSLTLMRINGKDLKTYFVSKGTSSFNGDTVFTTFGPSYFKTIGNLDTFLDQNETITLVDSTLIKGCRSLYTNFELSWGCNGKTCQVSKTSGSVIISNKSPNLVAIPLPVTPTCFYNNTFTSELRIVNTGNMPAIDPRIAISLNYPYMTSAYDTASVRIRVGTRGQWGKPVFDSLTSTYNQGYYSCIGTNPIGFYRFKVQQLLPNDTLFIRWDTKTCTPPACTNGIYVVNSWAYYAEYKDQCKNLKTIPWAWGKVYDYHYFTSSSYAPTDLVNNKTGEFRLLISTINLLPVTSSASYVTDLILPKGLIHSKLKKDLYFVNADFNGYWNPDSIVQKGDTIRAYFPQPIPINLTNAELIFYLKADCSKSGANGLQSIGLQIRYSPDKNCKPREWHYLTCQTLQTKVHCVSNCNGGMKFMNFSVERLNFGEADNDNDGIADLTGALDLLKIREERCITGDTLMAVYTGVTRSTSSILFWTHAYVESKVTNGNNLDIAGIELKIFKNGSIQSCTQVKSWKTVSGNDATFKIDLSTDSLLACVSSRFRYANGDSVVVKVKYKVSKNIGGAIVNLFFDNRFYTSNINNPTSNTNKFQCDTFSGQAILAGYYFTSCCSDVYQVNSCSEIAVNNYFYLGLGPCCSNYGGNNYFPYEYRNFAKLKSLKLNIPTGYKFKSGFFGQYRTSGSNKTELQTVDSLKPVNSRSSPLTFDVSKFYRDSVGGKIRLSDDGFHGYFVAYLEPSCEIQGNANPLNYDFIFEKKGVLGTGFDTIRNTNDDQLVYNKPLASVQATSPTIYAAQDTAEWELIYTNYSPTFSNINSWFAPDNSGAIKVVQIRDITGDTLLPSSGSIFRAGTMPYNNTRKFKIRAIYNSCKKDSVILYSGWNCQSYPVDIASYNCQKNKTVLYLEPQNTQYQVTLTDSVSTADLCAITPYVYTLENIGATAGYNTKAVLNLPIGMSVVPGSCRLRYPYKNGKTTIPSPVLKSGTTYEWDLSSISSSIKSGFKGVSDTAKNRLVIYFSVKTDCDYSSGNFIRATASGNIKCGDPVVTYPSISNPLNIKGVSRPYYTLLKVVSDSIYPCEKPTKVKVKIINLGPGKTGIEDKYQAVLLPGMNYDSSLYQAVYQSPDNSLTKKRNINGASEIEFSLRDNIVPGDSMEFDFAYFSDGKYLNCGPVDFYSQTAVKQEVICVADNSKCKINVVTGNSLIKPLVVKGGIMFSDLRSSLQSVSSDSETLNLQYRISNTGNKINNGKPLVYKIVYDQNGSGTIDKSDIVARVDTFKNGLFKNAYTVINKTIRVKAGQSCALFITLDSASCSCVFNSSRFPVAELRNAGKSQNECSGKTITLGVTKTNGYRYLWTPGTDFNSDTVARPQTVIENTSATPVSKRYILTTYRGLCSSKDTIDIQIYSQPQVYFSQQDTAMCEGAQVILNAVSKGGTGNPAIRWTPGNQVNDSTKFSTKTKTSKTQWFRAEITDTKGCKAADSLQIFVRPLPKARFTYVQGCQGTPLKLQDSSVIKGDKIVFNKWYAQGIDTVNSPFWNLGLGGNLQTSVKIEVKSSYGCVDSFRQTVYLNPLPKVDFSVRDVCFGDTIKAVNRSSVSKGNIVSSTWSMGDGKTFVSQDRQYVYKTSDTFGIRLVVKTDRNCTDTLVKPVVVYPRPKADFTAKDVCLGDSTHLISRSAIQKDSIALYIWSSGTFYSQLRAPVWLFKKDSSYRVDLKVSSAFGCSDSVVGFVTVNPNPKALFKSETVCEKTAGKISSLSTIRKGSVTSWQYMLSDGSSYQQPVFSHTFATGDTFDVTLVVASDKLCRDTVSQPVIVYPKLVPDFTFNDICVSGQLLPTDKTGFIHTSIKSWSWKFSGQDSSDVQNPVYQYTKWGTYDIGLRVTSNDGCVYDTIKKVKVYPLPKVNFDDTNRCIDNKFNLTSVLSIPSGKVSKVFWDFGDKTNSTDFNPFHVFPSAGSYQVKLIAESDFGCRDSFTKNISSYPPVLVDFSWKDICLGDVMVFSDQSVVPNSTIKTYAWDFGDGTGSKIKDPSHLFKSYGQFKVSLSVTTAYNCSYDTFHAAEVYPVPVAMFSTDPETSTILDPVINITDLSTGADSLWYDLGDGSQTQMRNLAKNYPDSGTYLIRQYVKNRFGCTDSFLKKTIIRYLFVFNAPTAFSPNNDGHNDVYGPGGIGISNYSMRIFNRWGELIYYTDNGTPWDGTYQGELVMDGVYAVSFKVRDFKGIWHFKTSSFVLLR
jgi:gliding motility-associated-like protein